LGISYFFQIFNFTGSSVIYLSLSEIPKWTHQRQFGLSDCGLHRKKKVREFPVPCRDVTTKLSLGGNNDVIAELFLPRGSLVRDIPAGDGKLVNLFLQCGVTHRKRVQERLCTYTLLLFY
jgi:hypothetical protein